MAQFVCEFVEEWLDSETIFRPRLDISLGKMSVGALLDSGADDILIPEFIADDLGLQKGAEGKTTGIGKTSFVTYETSVNMVLIPKRGGIKVLLNLPAIICPAVDDVIIGRRGFFDKFKITFDYAHKEIILEEY